MPFKPFAHLARVSFAKGLAHTYAPSVVAVGQSSYTTTANSLGQIQNYPVHKFAKTTHLHNAFSASSSSGSGAGAKSGHATQGSNADAGLAQYYAAWQHAQQTGDDSEWKQHQSARRIGWKSSDTSTDVRHVQRLDSARPADLLRPSHLATSRAYSENTVQDIKKTEDSFAEAEALARVDEAISQEIKAVQQSNAAENDLSTEQVASTQSAETTAQWSATVVENAESIGSSQGFSSNTDLTSPAIDEPTFLSQHIVALGQQRNYADIPAIFESMLKDGVEPSVEAYNHILMSAIQLSTGSYQVWPRALEVYSDMTRRAVEPNTRTYAILIDFVTYRGLEAYRVQKSLALRQSRFGNADGKFALRSAELVNELYAGDNSTVFATKLYNVARAKVTSFSLSAPSYNTLLKACIQAERIEDMKMIIADMKTNQIQVDVEMYAPLIDAFALVKDIAAAQKCYGEYRDMAILRSSNDSLDMVVYASLIKAYYTCELAETGIHFYSKVLESFAGAQNEEQLVSSLTASLVLRTLIPHHVAANDFAAALDSVKSYELSVLSRDLAMAEICISAADANDADAAKAAFSAISTASSNSLPLMAVAAMYVRRGRLADASALLGSSALQITSVDFATMYVTSLLRNGSVDEGLLQARKMFEQIRASAIQASDRGHVMDNIDEAIVLFGETLSQQHAILSSQDSINLIRIMIENGGLVSPVAQHAIASLGPDCIHQLSPQDIALALHVQAGMVPNWSEGSDIAHGARFSHLLETVLNRSIPMDPSTVHVVSEALLKLNGARPDLMQRWQELLQPAPKLPQTPQLFSPVFSPTIAPSSTAEVAPSADSYDPYAYNCDFRTSKLIEDQLESAVGRTENHLSDALSRFRNVRRAGRHLHYRAYAKLITAAGKTKQKNVMHEILGMAQADVQLLPQYASVNAGWVGIFDAVVSACLTIGDRQLAAKFHQDLLEMGAAPSANTFGIYITTLEGTFDEATEAVKIFQRALSEGVEPSVFLYNAVIGKLGKARRIDDCLFYFGDMQAKNIRPSSVTYGTLVNALCRTSEERFAEEMFDEMESMPNYRPRAAPYNSIIQYFLNTKRDRSKVLTYYERMKTKKIKPTGHTYKLLIEAHASLEPVNLTAAEAVLAEMKAAGVQPESVHYGSLIHAKGCVMHDMAGARAAFDAVLADGTVRPTDNLYQNLLESMVANHQVAQTDDVLQDMARRRVQMTPYIANTLIHGWAGEKDIGKAQKIYEGLGKEKREPSTYEAMTRAFLSVEDHESANVVVQEMLRKGYPAAVAEKVCALVGGGVGA